MLLLSNRASLMTVLLDFFVKGVKWESRITVRLQKTSLWFVSPLKIPVCLPPVGHVYPRLFHPLGCSGRPWRTNQNSPQTRCVDQEQGRQRPQQSQLPRQLAPHSRREVSDRNSYSCILPVFILCLHLHFCLLLSQEQFSGSQRHAGPQFPWQHAPSGPPPLHSQQPASDRHPLKAQQPPRPIRGSTHAHHTWNHRQWRQSCRGRH